jgi:hypothetical protein
MATDLPFPYRSMAASGKPLIPREQTRPYRPGRLFSKEVDMNGLIVAGVASIAGIAGVAGLTLATADTGPVPAAVSTPAPNVVAQRLARVREAERAADAALRRADPRGVVPRSASAAGPTLSREGHHGRDDAGEHRGRGRGRGHGEDD